MRLGYMKNATLAEKLDRYSMRTSCGCVIWLAGENGEGYGTIRNPKDQRKILAHRAAWELKNGPIPQGLHIDHLCRNHACINPDHMEPVTLGENVRRGIGGALLKERLAAITHCPQGHAYAGENLRLKTDKHGIVRRSCRACARIETAARRARKQGEN